MLGKSPARRGTRLAADRDGARGMVQLRRDRAVSGGADREQHRGFDDGGLLVAIKPGITGRVGQAQ